LDSKDNLEPELESLRLGKLMILFLLVVGLVCYMHCGAGSEVFERSQFEEFVEAVSAKKWEKAAKKLKETKWCQKHKHRCEDDEDIIRQGCDGSDESIAAAAAAAAISMITADATGAY
jgi:hypothetical protein